MHMHSWRIYAKVVTYREEVVDGLRLGIIACPLLLEYPLGPLLRQPVPLRKLLRQHLLCRLSLPLNGVLRTLNNIQIIVIIATYSKERKEKLRQSYTWIAMSTDRGRGRIGGAELVCLALI